MKLCSNEAAENPRKGQKFKDINDSLIALVCAKLYEGARSWVFKPNADDAIAGNARLYRQHNLKIDAHRQLKQNDVEAKFVRKSKRIRLNYQLIVRRDASRGRFILVFEEKIEKWFSEISFRFCGGEGFEELFLGDFWINLASNWSETLHNPIQNWKITKT